MYSYKTIKKELTVTIIGRYNPESSIRLLLGNTEIMGVDGNLKTIGDSIYQHFQKIIEPLKSTEIGRDYYLLLLDLECSLKDFIELENELLIVDFETYSEEEYEDNSYLSDLISQYFADGFQDLKVNIKLTVRSNAIRLLHSVQKKIKMIQYPYNENPNHEEKKDLGFELGNEMGYKVPFDFNVIDPDIQLNKAYKYMTGINFVYCSDSDFTGFFKGTRMKKRIQIGKLNVTYFGLLIKELTKMNHIVFIPSSLAKTEDYWAYVLQRTCDFEGAIIPQKTLITSKPKGLKAVKLKELVTKTLYILEIPS